MLQHVLSVFEYALSVFEYGSEILNSVRKTGQEPSGTPALRAHSSTECQSQYEHRDCLKPSEADFTETIRLHTSGTSGAP